MEHSYINRNGKIKHLLQQGADLFYSITWNYKLVCDSMSLNLSLFTSYNYRFKISTWHYYTQPPLSIVQCAFVLFIDGLFPPTKIQIASEFFVMVFQTRQLIVVLIADCPCKICNILKTHIIVTSQQLLKHFREI